MKVGLVLEGGSRQTIFSAGILDAMLDENIVYPYICGVSAGGHAAMNYVTRQKGRLRHIIMPTKLQRGKKHANRILDGIQKESHALPHTVRCRLIFKHFSIRLSSVNLLSPLAKRDVLLTFRKKTTKRICSILSMRAVLCRCFSR